MASCVSPCLPWAVSSGKLWFVTVRLSPSRRAALFAKLTRVSIFSGFFTQQQIVLSFFFLYCTAGNFREQFNFVAFVKAIFDKNKFLTTFSQNHKCGTGSETFMNVKINDKQKSDNRTAEEQTSDNWRLTKINSWRTAWRSLLTKFFADENFLLYSSCFNVCELAAATRPRAGKCFAFFFF